MLFAKQLIYRARAILDVLRVQDRACTIRKTIKTLCARGSILCFTSTGACVYYSDNDLCAVTLCAAPSPFL